MTGALPYLPLPQTYLNHPCSSRRGRPTEGTKAH
jgi:hypothetical protein